MLDPVNSACIRSRRLCRCTSPFCISVQPLSAYLFLHRISIAFREFPFLVFITLWLKENHIYHENHIYMDDSTVINIFKFCFFLNFFIIQMLCNVGERHSLRYFIETSDKKSRKRNLPPHGFLLIRVSQPELLA